MLEYTFLESSPLGNFIGRKKDLDQINHLASEGWEMFFIERVAEVRVNFIVSARVHDERVFWFRREKR